MKTLLLFIFLFAKISYAELSDGNPRYTIQVSSEKSYSLANKKIGQYRKYGYAFIYEKNLQCLNPKIKNCKEQKTFRIYLSIFKEQPLAKSFLDEMKTKNPNLFKGAIIQNLVE